MVGYNPVDFHLFMFRLIVRYEKSCLNHFIIIIILHGAVVMLAI